MKCSNKTRCVWCGPNSVPNNNKSCQCSPSYTQGIDGCYSLVGLNVNVAGSIYSTYIPKAAVGCFINSSTRDQESCSLLMNLCMFSLLDTSSNSSLCSRLKQQGLLYVPAGDLDQYKAQVTLSANDTSKLYSINAKLLKWYPNGTLASEATMRLGDIMQCQFSNESSTFKIGNNFKRSCDFNFNNIVNLLQSSRHVSHVMGLFVADHTGSYYQVPVYVNGGTDPVGRFFLQDTFSLAGSGKLTFAQTLTLEFTLSPDVLLTQPKLFVTYAQQPLNSLTGTLVTPVQTVTTEISFSYDLTNINKALLPIFIVVNALVLLHVTLRTYVAYRNRRSVLLFLPFLLQTWSTYMFFFLLVMSGYFFFFTKATQQIYAFLPKAASFYLGFYLVLGLMLLARLISDLHDKLDTIKSEIYLIDWEASPQRNSWRSMFIVNSLAEFYTYRTISFFWALAWTVFLLTGLSWELHSRQTTTLTQTNISSSNPINPVLMYFLCTSIMLVVGMLMKFLRRVLVIWWPYPFQDFLDYCSLANISLFFCKRNAPIGYYIDATNPEQSELTFKEINDQIAKGSLRKQRNFLADPIAQFEECKTYLVYLQNDFEARLNQLRRTEDLTELEPLNRKKRGPYNIREEFVEKYLKKLLMTVRQEHNQLLEPTVLQNCLGLPPVDLNEQRQLPTFIPSRDYEGASLFPNSNELHELLSFTMVFTLFSVLTASTAIGAFLSYLVFEVLYQWWIGRQTRQNIERFTKVKEGFML